jgi:hypothetical protein
MAVFGVIFALNTTSHPSHSGIAGKASSLQPNHMEFGVVLRLAFEETLRQEIRVSDKEVSEKL